MMKTIVIAVICVVALSQHSNCKAIEEEIYNGFNARRGQFPYQVLQIHQSKIDGTFSFCGGSLVSNQFIVTAAHCIYNVNQTTVHVGLTDMSDMTGVTTYILQEANYFFHPSYNRSNKQNDIAILKLPSNVTTNQYVGIINLPKKSQATPSTFENQMATASGWGHTTNYEKGIHQLLQYRTVNVYEHSECERSYSGLIQITNGMICTDKEVVHSGPCQGDSGGPLTVNGTDAKPMLIGAPSFMALSCSGGYPNVYTNIANYLDWINSVTGIAVS